MPDTFIYHNPDCGTSRNALALLRHCGIEPTVIEYLSSPPTKERLRELVAATGWSVRDVIRERGTPYKVLGLDQPALSDDALLDAMMAHPILINRPIVVTPDGVALCRPSEAVLDLLPATARPRSRLIKDDGTPFLADEPWTNFEDLEGRLREAGLPVDDLRAPGRRFFRYSTLDGVTVGYGGFELYGPDVLLRSLCVMPQFHRQGIGRNQVLLLMRRAFEAGARQAYALPGSPEAQVFFGQLHFTPIARADAPDTIRSTRQMAGLCPASTPLLTRRITL